MIPILRVFCMLRMHDTIVSPREYYLVSSFRSSPVDCSGSAVFYLHVGGLSCCLYCDVLCCAMWIFVDRIDGAICHLTLCSRWGDSGSVERKVFVHPAGIKPTNSHLWEECGTTRPLPVHLSLACNCMFSLTKIRSTSWFGRNDYTQTVPSPPP
jgi:hypothetical protein